jgi:hypothetical protein
MTTIALLTVATYDTCRIRVSMLGNFLGPPSSYRIGLGHRGWKGTHCRHYDL